jgi:chromosome segregation ATPase
MEIRERFQTEYGRLRSNASSLYAEEARLQQELQNVSQLLNAKYQQLKGESAAGRLSVQAVEDEESQPESGLYREQTRLELALAETRAADSSQPRVNSLQARLDKVNQLITQTLDEIDRLSERRVSVSRELEATREELLLAREQTEQVREILATTTPDAIVMEDPLNPELTSEYSVLSWPVMPEKRIGPPKAAIAVGIAAAITFFVILLILLQFYVATALREGEKRQQAS